MTHDTIAFNSHAGVTTPAPFAFALNRGLTGCGGGDGAESPAAPAPAPAAATANALTPASGKTPWHLVTRAKSSLRDGAGVWVVPGCRQPELISRRGTGMAIIRQWARGFGIAASVALSACGGGGDDVTPVAAPAATPAGGLYVGYYQEDPASNPEDPTPGAFSLNLPTGNGTFSGSMFFTYVGCQTSNVGAVSGTKTDLALSGNWSGAVDGLAEAGTYTGTYDATTGVYTGTYLNSGGKQFRDLRPCIQYYIAPNGVFEMFAIEGHLPATFAVSVTTATRGIAWGAVSGAATTLVYVLDPAIATSTGNPVLWQTVLSSGVSVTVPTTVALVSGRPYIAVVGVLNASFRRIAFSSQRFTAP